MMDHARLGRATFQSHLQGSEGRNGAQMVFHGSFDHSTQMGTEHDRLEHMLLA